VYASRGIALHNAMFIEKRYSILIYKIYRMPMFGNSWKKLLHAAENVTSAQIAFH
jgi:hypothetical protein